MIRKLIVSLAAFAATAFISSYAAQANDKAVIVLDASGSMWGQIDGKTKIEIARETLSGVLDTLPAGLDLGLVAYGHREKGNCSDIEEIVAPGPDSRQSIRDAVGKLNPKGKTPIADSVKAAAEALRFTEDKATVIVITDGIETCSADPCALASELDKMGVDFTAHVIGFGLSEEEGRQVACLAENTGGKYLQASNADELSGALTETVAAKPEPKPEPAVTEENIRMTAVLAEGGPDYDLNGRWDYFPMTGDTPSDDSIAGGYDTEFTTTLEPGRYLLRYRKDAAQAETVVDVKAGEAIDRELVLDAGVVTVRVLAEEGGEPDHAGRFDLKNGEAEGGAYGEGTLVFPAGEVSLSTRLGKSDAEETFQLKAGETVIKDIVMGIGILKINAVYAEGGPAVEGGDLRVDVLSGKKSLDGKRQEIDGAYGPGNEFKLPPGDYVVKARLQNAIVEQEVSVPRGEMTEVTVDLNAGVLSAKAPGAYRIDIFEAKTGLEGNRKQIDGTYGEEYQITLHPGEYLVVATMGDSQGAKKETAATVAAAERAEVTID